MSLKLNERYPGRFNNPSADYPLGSFKNRTAPGAKDGSYLEKDWANDKEGFFQSLLSAVGVDPNGDVDKVGSSQFYDALLQARQNQVGTAFTTEGVAPAFTLTPSPAIIAYAESQRFRIKFNASSASCTLNISGKGAKNLKQYNASGAKVDAAVVSGQLADVEYDGTDMVVINPLSYTSQATETVIGVSKVATQSLTNAGASDTTLVSPKKLKNGYAAVLSDNGYIKLPSWLGGLTFQWMTVTATSTITAFTFPTPFTTLLGASAGFFNISELATGTVQVVFIKASTDVNISLQCGGAAKVCKVFAWGI